MSEIEHMGEVDRHPGVHRATEADEEQVLRGLYGEPDQYGVFQGVEG
ncbi:hypothetical protein [Actinomadura rubrisoli]|nr:hypothetical protein [Actinomadura rubrisoli]